MSAIQVFEGDAVDPDKVWDRIVVLTARMTAKQLECAAQTKKRTGARRNRNRQRQKEEEGRDVRQPSSLWEQVVRDYNMSIRELENGILELSSDIARLEISCPAAL